MTTVAELKRGDKVAWPNKGIRIVKSVVEMKPTCLAEHIVCWDDGTQDRVCNHKALVVVPREKRK